MLAIQELPCPKDESSINDDVEINGLTYKGDKIKNENIQDKIGVASVVDKTPRFRRVVKMHKCPSEEM